ncbi:MAG: Co2+/Mg2+ efflux protein ApaG [Planctomycetes bacterium]|nr:Co2+/Mg2+ efflux protein ApaG [Planctomycetota bacterium]
MATSPYSDITTDGLRIQAAAEPLPQEQLPPELAGDGRQARAQHVFRYKITMTNVGERSARLLSRHWIIVDANGKREDVRGKGVVGEYPQLAPGESYSYLSFCPLPTTWGTMEGSYQFERDDGSRFAVAIGRFFLVPSAPPLPLESTSN